jgi:DtxR family Mn-dependent transcriptional regulator
MACHLGKFRKGESTPAEDEYVEAIYARHERGQKRIRASEIRSDLKVKGSSVTQMLKKLEKKGLVHYDLYGGVELTRKGRSHGLLIKRRHRLAERLLKDVLGYDLASVHDEACKLEHVLNDEVADKISRIIGDVKTCPHGNPIPSKQGEAGKLEAVSLIDIEEGEECTIQAIPEDKEDVQRLIPFNILPGASVKVVEKTPFGTIMVQSCGGTQLALSSDIASKILVKPHGEEKRHGHRHGFGWKLKRG